MVVICYGRDAKGYGRRILELSNATLHITLDTNSTEKKTLKSVLLDLDLPAP